MRRVEERACTLYRATFGTDPAVLTSAPGRINLIGEHTDYNDGFVLPCAIDRRIAIAAGPGNGGLVSDDFPERSTVLPQKGGTWTDYPSAVAWALTEAGHHLPDSWQAAFAGDVPRASGLSSSAAIEAGSILALTDLAGIELPRTKMAVLCQRAENHFVGVNSGIMDQYASLLCTAGAALLIDCRSLQARSVPLPLRSASLTLAVCDTRVERRLGSTGYNERRAACERAAAILGVPALRDAGMADLQRLNGVELKRARHVVTENVRVLEAVEALERSDFAAFGALMYASHQSLRDDYEVSVPELDAFVTVAREEGALGARMTGAGFGGCAVALVHQDAVDGLRETTMHQFQNAGFTEPVLYTFEPSDGAEVVR